VRVSSASVIVYVLVYNLRSLQLRSAVQQYNSVGEEDMHYAAGRGNSFTQCGDARGTSWLWVVCGRTFVGPTPWLTLSPRIGLTSSQPYSISSSSSSSSKHRRCGQRLVIGPGVRSCMIISIITISRIRMIVVGITCVTIITISIIIGIIISTTLNNDNIIVIFIAIVIVIGIVVIIIIVTSLVTIIIVSMNVIIIIVFVGVLMVANSLVIITVAKHQHSNCCHC
jgi:hypothetical protein